MLVVQALLLAAIWGASFLFMRIGAPEFGPLALMSLRVGIAALCLLPVLVFTRGTRALREHWRPMFMVGVLNSAIPFTLLTYSTLSLTAGFTSILNATTPFWSALVAYLWIGERLGWSRLAGLALGIIGVGVLVADKTEMPAGTGAYVVGAALLATASYGLAANFARQRLAGVDALSSATGSMLAASAVLVPLGIWFWPASVPSTQAWIAAVVLGVIGTALAYIFYFRLIARWGATRAATITFLIPVFGVGWGAMFLNETISMGMVAGGLLILAGTSLTLGLVGTQFGKVRP